MHELAGNPEKMTQKYLYLPYIKNYPPWLA